MNYLLDTCVISDFFKKIPAVVHQLKKRSPGQIHVSTVTIMEIEYGLRLHEEREKKIRPQWESLLQQIRVVPFSSPCACAAATLRSKLKSIGLPIGPYDILIAGTSLAHDFILVTSNFNEFKRINEIEIEDWRESGS